jgi:hypothetical protein
MLRLVVLGVHVEVETSGWPCMGSGEDRRLVLAFSLAQSSKQVSRGVNSVTPKQLGFVSLEYIRSYSYNHPSQTPLAIETARSPTNKCLMNS